MSKTIYPMNRPCQIPALRFDMDSVEKAILDTRYNYETKADDIYSVWACRKGQPGVRHKIADGLTEGQARYVRDAFNAALRGGGRFDLAATLRRYDAGF